MISAVTKVKIPTMCRYPKVGVWVMRKNFPNSLLDFRAGTHHLLLMPPSPTYVPTRDGWILSVLTLKAMSFETPIYPSL